MLRPQDEGYLVGGFSITSTPKQAEAGDVELAIRHSPNRPVTWALTIANEGDVVGLRAGGSFSCDINEAGRPILLISGGIGITPFMSMLRAFRDEMENGSAKPEQRVRLLHFSKESSDIVFYDELAELCALHGGGKEQVHCHFSLTGPGPSLSAPAGVTLGEGRITKRLIESYVSSSSPGLPRCYVCGPPAMVEGVAGMLQEVGVPLGDVIWERWW